MVLGAFLSGIVLVFLLVGTLLFKYGNVFRHHIAVTLSVLIAWYFSVLIIFILPLDVSSTVFRQCVEQNIHNSTKDFNNTTSTPFVTCIDPLPNVPENVFPNLWRIVYWTSQFLTWLILPLMQSYIKAGDFTVRGKLKSALIDNAIYYGSYLFICGILLIYIALKPGLDLDGQKLKAIASSASNTWGLFLLVLLLGYALVEVPRGLWNSSKPGYTLNYSYFKVAKLSLDKCEAEETVDDILESLQIATISIGPGHPFHYNLETIFQKIPAELKDRMNRRQLPDDTPTDAPTEKSLIRLHRQTIKALQTLQRIETQWGILVSKIFDLEDVAKNQVSHDRRFKQSFPKHRSLPFRIIYNPVVEWYWKCIVKNYVLKAAAICAGCLSVAVVWSEVTFFNKSPVLSLFAQFLNLAKRNYDYFTIEMLSTLIIAYLCYCAYSTVLKIRVLNLYYLAPNHQTNEYSLIFSGMMLCRLTPPMCLNFLGLIHMDSHIIKTHILETHYTQVMGHMDVISIISDGFNVYFPMAILAFCLATYFSIGSRLLSMLGFQQFLDDDEFTTDLVDEGRELIKRERRKRQRAEDSMYRRRELQERFNISVGSGSRYRTSRQSTDTVRPLKRDESIESARAGLLHDFDPAEYYIGMTFSGESYGANNQCDIENQGDIDSYDASNVRAFSTSTSRVGPPPRGLFDDI
ncbi:LMBR1 domain-containing protein 2 homolog isoform X2 [Pogonomyrmex barbatus]|uniref:LMBR1 domain-containing protein 2 homolog isoform X2 n=1 Tax=Pogonomyrmex barbatus TaxID=144034 RepID=A0A6I9WK67_9HYME|nr:LMBR1 domain-containing protein 2 homolog isoform X2 [Pogonomyrmex barbatus]